ncbi:MAG: hypothetical protein WCH21_09070, partial [Bacteroidota bacterium]
SKLFLAFLSTKASKKFKQAGVTFRPFYYPNLLKLKDLQLLQRKLVHKRGYEIVTHPSMAADFKDFKINGRAIKKIKSVLNNRKKQNQKNRYKYCFFKYVRRIIH